MDALSGPGLLPPSQVWVFVFFSPQPLDSTSLSHIGAQQLGAAWPRPARCCGRAAVTAENYHSHLWTYHGAEHHTNITTVSQASLTSSTSIVSYSEISDGLGYQSLNVFAKLWRKVLNYNCNPSLPALTARCDSRVGVGLGQVQI